MRGSYTVKNHMRSSREETASLFSRAAPTYNAAGPRHFTYFARRLVEFAGVQPGHRLLDVATGTGEVLLASARGIGETGQIVGIDLSEAMLRHAAAMVKSQHIGNATLRVMDAEHLDFAAESFDVVLCSFGLSSFPNRDRALTGFQRVLRAGGRLGLLDTFGWYFQHDARWRWQQDVLRSFGVMLGETLTVDDTEELTTAVARAGFADIEPSQASCDLIFHDEEEWWWWAWCHGTRSLFEAVPLARLDELKRQLLIGLDKCRREDGMIHGRMCATLICASKPLGDASRAVRPGGHSANLD